MAKNQAMEQFAAAAKAGLADEQFSDFTIVCGKHFKVHRFIISTHSKYFKTCCSSNFKEGHTQSIELRVDLSEVVERMISFFYAFDYDDTIKREPSDELEEGQPKNRAAMNAWIYAVAEKYEIPGLKALALEKFWQNTKSTSVHHMLEAAYTIFKYTAVPESDNTLKDMFCFMWFMGGERLMSNVGAEALLALNTSAPQFASHYMSRITRHRQDLHYRVHCSSCGQYRDQWKNDGTKMPEIKMGRDCKDCLWTSATIMGLEMNLPISASKNR